MEQYQMLAEYEKSRTVEEDDGLNSLSSRPRGLYTRLGAHSLGRARQTGLQTLAAQEGLD